METVAVYDHASHYRYIYGCSLFSVCLKLESYTLDKEKQVSLKIHFFSVQQ